MLSHLQHCRPGAGASVNLTARPFPDADSLAELLRLHGHSVRVAHDPMIALAIAAELTSKSARNCWTKSPERSAGRRQA